LLFGNGPGSAFGNGGKAAVVIASIQQLSAKSQAGRITHDVHANGRVRAH
jgi:hypothetical protein